MRREKELELKILLEIEEHCDGRRPRMMGGVEGYSEDQVEYHLRLLVNAGYVETSKSSMRFVRGLTLAGHDYLDSIRPSELAVRIGQSRSRVGGGVTVPLSCRVGERRACCSVGE